MPARERFKTNYAGVFYIIGEGARGSEKIFYIRYRKDGKLVEEKAGRQFADDMTAAKASGIRSQRIDKKQLSNTEKREEARIAKEAEAGKWTIDKLWKQYKEDKTNIKGLKNDEYRYHRYLQEPFGDKTPAEILSLDVNRLRFTLEKTKSPQTTKHILILFDRIVNHGRKEGYTEGFSFKIKKPLVQNVKTEDLDDDQIRALLAAIESDSHKIAGDMLKMALFTGMRRGEIFKLRWEDLDFRRKLILIRDPKGGKDQVIPMNAQAKALLKSQTQKESPYVFPTDEGKQRQTVANQVRRIREAAGLPKDFRPFHGLRHVYASMLASSGAVDMYVLQRLLTHKTPAMTARYAHLRDEATRKAAGLAGDLLDQVINSSQKQLHGRK